MEYNAFQILEFSEFYYTCLFAYKVGRLSKLYVNLDGPKTQPLVSII